MKKKGVQVELMTLIIIIVAFIFILLLVQQVNDYIKKSNDREYCRLSIVSMDAAKISGKSTVFHLDCPMQHINIKDSNLPKEDSKKKDAVLRKISDAAYDCWYQSGRGEYHNLESELIEVGLRQDVYCLLCSRISFDLKEPITVPLTESEDWLKKNSPIGSSQKYSDYLSYNGHNSYFYLGKKNELSTENNYYMVLSTIRDHTVVEKSITHLAIIGFFTNSKGLAYVGIVEEEDFANMGCQALAN